MVCIFCASKTQVINSRHQKRLNQVWRRRKCLSCSSIFSSIERINLSNSLLILSKTGKVEDFVKEKLLISIYDSLRHREQALLDSIYITDTIISMTLKSLKTPLIDRNILIKNSSKALYNFDTAASVYYLAYNPILEKDGAVK